MQARCFYVPHPHAPSRAYPPTSPTCASRHKPGTRRAMVSGKHGTGLDTQDHSFGFRSLPACLFANVNPHSLQALWRHRHDSSRMGAQNQQPNVILSINSSCIMCMLDMIVYPLLSRVGQPLPGCATAAPLPATGACLL